MRSATSYNQNLQKEKKTERSSYFDLQTMRIQKVRQTNPTVTYKSGYPNGPYPVTLLNGQYQHNYKKYTTNELNHLPLNTVLYASDTPLPIQYDHWKMKQQNPLKTHRIFKKCDSSDDDEPSSSKQPDNPVTDLHLNPTTKPYFQSPQSFTSNNKSTPLTINAHLLSAHLAAQTQQPIHSSNTSGAFRMTVSAAPTVANLISSSNQKQTTPTIARQPVFKTCYVCSKSSQTNIPNASASNTDQFMVHCKSCDRYSHPTCLELNPALVKWQAILDYQWQCMDCKKCTACSDPHDEDKMMFCDKCDRGFHTYCVGLNEVPSGSFFCKSCDKKPETATTVINRICLDESNSVVKSQLSTPVRLLEKVKATPDSNTRRERVYGGKRGRPLGSLNKPKDPNSPRKASSKKLKKLDHSLNYSTYGDLSQSQIDTNSNTMPFANNEVSMDGNSNSNNYNMIHDDRSQSLSYDNFKNIININLNTDSLIQPMF